MTLPFENDTNSFIKKLASAQLKKERLKKIFTIVAISLATFTCNSCWTNCGNCSGLYFNSAWI